MSFVGSVECSCFRLSVRYGVGAHGVWVGVRVQSFQLDSCLLDGQAHPGASWFQLASLSLQSSCVP